jgi:hypothetical protein
MRGEVEPNGYELALRNVGERYALECDENYRLKEWLFRDIKARRMLVRLYRQYGRDRLVDILEDFVQDEKISSRM